MVKKYLVCYHYSVPGPYGDDETEHCKAIVYSEKEVKELIYKYWVDSIYELSNEIDPKKFN